MTSRLWLENRMAYQAENGPDLEDYFVVGPGYNGPETEWDSDWQWPDDYDGPGVYDDGSEIQAEPFGNYWKGIM